MLAAALGADEGRGGGESLLVVSSFSLIFLASKVNVCLYSAFDATVLLLWPVSSRCYS